jgi:hypothetical protein
VSVTPKIRESPDTGEEEYIFTHKINVNGNTTN